MLVTVDCCSNWWWGVDYKEMKSMEDEIQCHGQLDGGIWLLLYWGWCNCRQSTATGTGSTRALRYVGLWKARMPTAAAVCVFF
jgi:hypothetical protein